MNNNSNETQTFNYSNMVHHLAIESYGNVGGIFDSRLQESHER